MKSLDKDEIFGPTTRTKMKSLDSGIAEITLFKELDPVHGTPNFVNL